jgi:hypothetical protein
MGLSHLILEYSKNAKVLPVQKSVAYNIKYQDENCWILHILQVTGEARGGAAG